ncbi:thiamine pyrophosphate-requiring protein [Aliihoeflea sp. PC F10.4]
MTAGGALLARLKAVGVDYIFANSGTDFPPIIEGLSEASAKNIDLPQALVMPHESAAMGMAHGYYLATRRAQAVMAHTNVGLANCAMGAINAAAEQIPVLLFSGRTPTTEEKRLGTRTVPIGWGQEMRDQTALVREASKWDYELRFPEQVPQLVDRAYAIANSTPPGPVYVSLPRETLCESIEFKDLSAPATMTAARAAAHPDSLAAAIELLAAAERPMIIAQRGCGDANGFEALAKLAQDWAIPVVQYWAIQLAIAADHPMSAGTDPAPYINDADVILVIDSLAPWSPDIHKLRDDAKVIQIGRDPLYARFPIRNFAAHVSIQGAIEDILGALQKGLEQHRADASRRIETRRAPIAQQASDRRRRVTVQARGGSGEPMTKDFVSLTLSEALWDRDAAVLSELGCPLEPLQLKRPNSWYQEPHSGGLGWAFPAALGMSLANRDRLTIATMGDGSYLFSNAPACHQIAEALDLPVLVLVLNNSEWGAVRNSVLGIYPDGYAAKSNSMPLTSLNPTPDFTKIAAASRAWTASVRDGRALPQVLAEAIHHIETKRSQALVEIAIRA